MLYNIFYQWSDFDFVTDFEVKGWNIGVIKNIAKYSLKIVAGTVCLVLDEACHTDINSGVQRGINALFDGNTNEEEGFNTA